MAEPAGDRAVLSRIESLVHEEQTLYAKGQIETHEKARLHQIQVELDQCWDLLRQRRALREFGEDPERAKVRPATIVEGYEQ